MDQGTKTPATFWLEVDGHPEMQRGPFEGLLHLFEHRYDEQTTFWFGVAEIGCTFQDWRETFFKPSPPDAFRVKVVLPDGRCGGTRCLPRRLRGGPQGDCITAALVGYRQLE